MTVIFRPSRPATASAAAVQGGTGDILMYSDGVLNPVFHKDHDYSFGACTEWSSVTAYSAGDYVHDTAAGHNFMCIASNTNQEPPNATFWSLTTNGASPGGAVDNLNDPYGPQAGHTYSWAVGGQFSGLQQGTTYDASPFGLDISGCVAIELAIKPPSATTNALYFHYSRSGGDDIGTCAAIDDMSVTGALTANVWNTGRRYPLSHLGALGSDAYYKWAINQSTAGPTKIDDVKFIGGTTKFVYNHNALVAGWSATLTGCTLDTSFAPNTLGPAFYALNQAPALSPVASALCMHVNATASHPIVEFRFANFSLAGLAHFTFAQYSTKSGYGYSVQFLDTSNTPVGNLVAMAPYTLYDRGLQSGVPTNWTVYDALLTAFGSLPGTIGGFRITETSSNTTNDFYLSAPAFTSAW